MLTKLLLVSILTQCGSQTSSITSHWSFINMESQSPWQTTSIRSALYQDAQMTYAQWSMRSLYLAYIWLVRCLKKWWCPLWTRTKATARWKLQRSAWETFRALSGQRRRWETHLYQFLWNFLDTLHAFSCLKTQLLLIIVFSPWCKDSIYRQHADICRSFGFLHCKCGWLKGYCWHLNKKSNDSKLCKFNYFL